MIIQRKVKETNDTKWFHEAKGNILIPQTSVV